MKYNFTKIIPEDLINIDRVKNSEEYVKLKLLDKIKTEIFTDRYLIIKGNIKKLKMRKNLILKALKSRVK